MFYVVLVCRNIKLHLKGQSSTKVKCNLTFLESSLQILSTEGADLCTELSSVRKEDIIEMKDKVHVGIFH